VAATATATAAAVVAAKLKLDIILHFSIKVNQWNGNDITHLHGAMLHSSLQIIEYDATAAINKFAIYRF